MKKIQLVLAVIVALGLTDQALAATYFTNESTFNTAAAGFGARTVESFEGTPSSSTTTSLTFGNATFSCSGITYCPNFFGQSTILHSLGSTSVYGATPDLLTFTFASPIKVFAVDVLDLGTVGATNFSMSLSNGSSSTLFTNLSQPTGTVNFAGAIDTAGFTSVTFSATAPNDGIYFDRLQFTTAVPEPETYGMMLAGLGLMGFMMHRRKEEQV